MVQTFPGNVCNVTFTGATSNTVTGIGATCNFNQITVNKGASIANIIDVQRTITMSSPTAAGPYLTLTNGTFKLSSASTLTPYYGAATICAASGRLWINNAAANISCVGAGTTTTPGVPTVTGTLQVTSGTFEYGSGNDQLVLTAAAAALNIDGVNGTVKIYGGLNNNGPGSISISSGTLIFDCQRTDSGGDNFTAAAHMIDIRGAVNFTGGSMIIVDPSAYAISSNVATLLLWDLSGADVFTGSTIQFGDGSSTSTGGSADAFDVRTNNAGTYRLGDIIVNTATGANRAVKFWNADGQFYVGGNITISSGASSELDLNGRTLTLNGNLINNGTLRTAVAGSSLIMGGTSAQIISGSGAFTDGNAGRILSLTINNTSGTSPAVDLQRNLTIASNNGALSLTSGEFGTTIDSTITIGAGVAATLTATRTNGIMSLTPVWNIAGGIPSYNLVYNASAAPLTTGNEMPSSLDAIINNITVNNNSGVLIGQNDITIQGTLTLTNGVVDFQDKTVNFVSGAAPIARTNGTITTSPSGTINFGTPALMTGASITIPANTFTNNPTQIGDLAINKSANHTLTWNNQGLTINGTLTLNLTSATKIFSIGANTLTFQDDDSPIVWTSGTITTAPGTILKFGDTGHTAGGVFSLPASLFTPFTRTTGTLTPGATAGLIFNANVNPFTFPDDLFTTSPATFASLSISRGAGILITLGNQELNVTGTTTLNSGILEILNADLQIAAIGGTPSANSMIVTNGTGYLKRSFPSGASAAYSFPIGDNTGGLNEYSPARFTFSANATAGTLGVKVTDAKHPANTETDNYITRYWSFNAPLLTTYTYSAQFTYPAADVVGTDEANFRMQRYDNGLSTWKSDVGSITVPGAPSTLTTSASLTEISGWLNNNDITSFTAPETYYWSRANGNWNGGSAVWVVTDDNNDPGAGGTPTSVVPDRTNNKGITIRNGHTITLTAGTYTADQMTVATGGVLTMNANNFTLYNGAGTDLTVGGTVNTTGGQLISAEAGVAIAVNGTVNTTDLDGFSIDANSTIPTTNSPSLTLGANSTINFSGAAGQRLDTRTDYGNLQATNAGAKIAQGAITVNKDLTVTNATFDHNDNTITLRGGATFTGTGTMSGSGLLYLNGGTASHTISGNNATIINLELDDANGASFSGATNIISGNLVVTRGTLVLNAFTNLTVNGTTSIGTGASAAAIAINSTAGGKTFTGLITVGANGTWNNSSNESFTIRGNIVNVSPGTFNAGTGIYTFDTSDQSFTGTFSIPNVTITGVNLTNNNSLTVSTALTGATGTLTQAANATLNIGATAASLTLGTLNAHASGNTVNYNRAGDQTIKIPAAGYYHLITSVSGIKTVPAALNVLGDLTTSAGTLAMTINNVQLNGNLVNNGTHTGTTGAIVLTGGTATHNISGTGTSFNVTLNDSNGATLLSNAQINGTLTLTSGVIHLGAYDLTLGSTLAIGGAFSSSNMIETGDAGRVIRSASANNNAFNLTYPVGSGGYYSPLIVSGLAGVGAAPRSFSVRAVPTNPGVLTNGIKKYWELSASGIALAGMSLSFDWDAGEVVGDALLFRPYTNTSGSWALATGASAPGTKPATSTGSATINGNWTVGAPSTFYSYQTGNWNQASTWTFDPGGTTGPGTLVPGQNDKVVILSGRTVTLSANVFTQNLDITINDGGILDQGVRRFTNTLAALRGDGVLKLASSFFPAATVNTFVTIDGGITEYNNNGSMSATQSTYYHLVIRSAGTVSTVNDITLNGDLSVAQGTLEIIDAIDGRLKLIVKGDFTVDIPGTISVSTDDTRSDAGPMPSIDGSTGGYLNYYENNSHRIEIFGDFINNGTVKFSNLTYPMYDQFPSDGFATVYMRGITDNVLTCNGISEFYNLIIDKGTDQTYKVTLYSAGYSKFKLYGANIAPASAAGTNANPDIKKALWIKNGTLILKGMTAIPSLSEGLSAISMPNYLSSDYFIPSRGALVLDGPGVIVLGTADSYTEVNAAYGLSGGSDFDYGINTVGGYSGIANLGKLQVNEGYLSTRESAGLLYYSYASGQYIINGGTVDTKQFHDPEGGTSGLVSYVQTGGDLIIRGRFTNSYTYAVPEDLTTPDINTTRILNGIDAAAGVGAFSINSNAANGFIMGGGTITVHDVCNASATPLAVNIGCPSSNINVTGGTVIIRPTSGAADDADYLVGSNGPFYNFTVDRKDGTSVVDLNSDLEVLNDFSITSGDLTSTASNYNLTVGGDFNVASGTTYDAQSNTTTFNGSALQTVTADLAAALTFNNLTIRKPAGITLNFAGSQKTVDVTGAFRLEDGTMNDSGNTINIAGNVFNSGIHEGTGKLVLNGTSEQTIDGDGTFSSIDLFNTAGAAAPVSLLAGMKVNGDLNFANDKQFDIGIFNVTLGDTATLQNTDGTKYFKTAGNVGDGGLTKIFTSATSFDYPLGVTAYTPATITINGAPASYGSVTVIPVNYEHPNVTAPGRCITYFWRTKSSGFDLTGGSVTHKYTYAAEDIVTGGDVTEDGYIAARYNVPATSWTKIPLSDVDEGNRVIGGAGSGGFIENSSVIDGDYTCGDDNATNPFGVPTTYYSIADGLWANGNTWSTVSHVGAPAGTWPGASDIAIIAAGDSIYLYNSPTYPYNTATVSCATLMIEAGGVLDIGNNPGSVFSMVQSHPSGNGKFRITATRTTGGPGVPPYNITTFQFPSGDFSDFNINLGTTDFYTTEQDGTSVWILPPISYVGNMILSPLGTPASGDNMVLQNVPSLTIYGDLTLNGASNASAIGLSWNTNDATYGFSNSYLTVEKTVTVRGDLIINGGSLTYYDDDVPQHLVVEGDIIISNATNGASILMWDDDNGWNPHHFGPTIDNTLTVGGNIINNGTSVSVFRGLNLFSGSADTDPHWVNVTYTGSNNTTVSGSGEIIYHNVIVNKGTTQTPTVTLNSTGTHSTPVDNWLTLQNGTLIYNRTGNLNISTGSTFTIAPTAGLTINTPSNVYIGNSNSDANDLILNGKLTIVSGNVYVGPVTSTNWNNDIEYSVGGASSLDIQGGTLTVNGQIRRNTSSAGGILTYSQSGGNVMIRGQKQNGSNAKLEVLNTGSSFTMSGGTLTIMRGNGATITPSSPFGDLYLRPETGSVTGGKIVFSQVGMAPAPVTPQNYFLDATIPLDTLIISGASVANYAKVRLLTSPLTVNGDLNINANSVFDANNINATFNGNFINTPGVGGYIAGTNLTTFSASAGAPYAGVQTISGATNFYDLTISPAASDTLKNPITVNRNLTINSGTFILAGNPVTVLGDVTNNASYTDNNTAGSGLLLNGTTQQHISGTGAFSRLTLNNATGAIVENNISVQEDLTLTLGVLDIKKYLLTLGTGANLEGAPFSALKMITSDGVFSNVGIRKFFNPGPTTFLYPLGTNGKYTPAFVTTTASSTVGYIRVNNISSRHPAVLDAANSLNYYWEIQSSGITGYDGTIDLNYLQSDVAGDEPNYVSARTVVPGSSWVVAPGVDFTNNKITFTHTGLNNLSGEYTAGIATAFYVNTPVFTSIADGYWDDPAIWTQTGGDILPGGCPAGGPNGFIVNINHVVSIRTHNCSAYRTTINKELRIEEPYFGHNFGTVYGSGSLHLERGTFPAGVFTSFLSCASGGTVDYGGIGTYTIIADLYDNIPNLMFTGTGTRVLPNKDLTICDTLTINGPVADNSVYSKKLTIQGGMKHLAGSFNSGTGAGAIVSFAGTIPQTIGGTKMGNFIGASAFNHFEINNTAGLRINDNGAIEVKGNLMLTNGLINTGSNRTLTITNSAISPVVPAGGSATSFVDGPLTKNISQFDNFLFPIGINKSGTYVLGNKLNISSAQPGPALWTAQYKNPNPTSTSFTSPILGVSAMEYFTITSTAGSKSKVNINWNPSSDVNPVIVGGIANMRVVNYSGGSWVEVPTTAAGDNNNGTASSTGLVTYTGSDDYTLGSVTTLIPRASFTPSGPVCGNSGIPVTFTAPGAIPFNYVLSYTINGAAQAPVTITLAMIPYTLPTAVPGTYKLTGFTYNSGANTGVVNTTPVTAYATPTTSNAGLDQVLCGVSTTNLTGNTPAVGTGFWTKVSGTGETILTPSSPTSQFIGQNGNAYTLQWTIFNGNCTSVDSVDINFTILPDPPAAASPQYFCGGPRTIADLVATAPAGCSVDWYSAASGGGKYNSTDALTTGTTYWGESNGGCVSLTRTPVLVNIYPLPFPGLTGSNSVCLNSTGNVYNTESGKTNYIWTVVGGSVTSGGLGTSDFATVTWNTAGAQSISVNYQDVGGCSAPTPTSLSVTVHALPVPTITGPDPACENSTGNTYVTEAGMSNYLWSVSGGGTITAGGGTGNNLAVVTWNTPGVQTISVNYTDGFGCTATSETTYPVTIDPLPDAAGAISGTAALCQGQSSVAYTVGAITNASSYAWAYSGTGATINGATNSITIDFASNATSGDLTVRGSNTCGNGTVSANYAITVNTLPTAPIVGTITQPTCALSTGSVDLSGLPAGNWTINPGAIAGNTISTTISGLASGTYNFTVTSASTGCTSPASANVVINAIPTPPAVPTTSSVTQPTCGVPSGTIVFNAQAGVQYSVDGITYQAGTTFGSLAPGTYTLYVRSIVDNTCITTGAATVTINAIPTPPAVPTTSSVTQPTCAVPTGTIVFTAQAGVEYSVGGAYQPGPTRHRQE
ncbi:MAG: hypothetical protein MUF36_07755 [Bacteroidales bacterium]|nr:hypothetical protein [Bacteroidales bacterium]